MIHACRALSLSLKYHSIFNLVLTRANNIILSPPPFFPCSLFPLFPKVLVLVTIGE